MPIVSSSNSIPSQVDLPPAFKIYRHYNDKDDWDGDIFLDKTTQSEIYEPAPAPPPPPPPLVVLVQGPPNVGKSLLIKSLVKHFTEENLDDIRGTITILTGDGDNRRRLQFVECPDNINYMIDAAKYADLVLLLVDASYGFEAETFEFVNLLRAHGFPQVMGVLTHLDKLKVETELDETKVQLQDHFRTEIYKGATISCLSGLDHGLYKMSELEELAEEILTLQSYLSSWKGTRPYVLVDRFEDVTPPEKMDKDANCDRNINLYGYLRGCNIKRGAKVHIAGLADFRLAGVGSSTDPLPLSELVNENDVVEQTLIENETFRKGTYLRLEVHDVSFGMVQNLDPRHPILVGGISLEEEDFGRMQARLKRHKWHMKLLRSEDPVTVSAGWRRYQTKPVYAIARDNGQHPFMEFNSEHVNCLAMFWGPLAPPGTRIAVVQSNKDMFRIAAKAVILDPKHQSKTMSESKQKGISGVLDPKHQPKIMKESKQKKILSHKTLKRRTALNILDKARKRKGMARCTFGKRICTSDIYIRPVLNQVPCFSDPLKAALEPSDITVPVDKDDSAEEWLKLERRRRVEITDEEPSSYPCTSHFMLFCSMSVKIKEPVVIMSEEKRAELVGKQQTEKFEKERKEFFSGVGRELVDL